MRNNILVNTSIPGSSSSGLTMAFGTDASSPYDAYSDYSNNNLFYAGSSGSKNVIFSDGSSNYQTLSDFKSAIGKKRDSLSIWSKPDFISPINLHLSASNNCSIKGHGAVITNPFAIKYDIDSNVRSTTNPDLGADEFKASKSGVWMGLNNKNWTNGVNWCDGIAPTDSVDVYISANAPYQPEHSSGTAQCRNLVIDSFASLTVSGGTFTLNGNLDDRSFFSTGKGSEFILGGNKTQNVSSPSALSFDKLTTSGNSIKSFTKNIYVSSELNLGAGNLKLNGDTLFLNGKLINDAMYSGNGAIVLTRGSASHDLSGKGNFANLILNDSIGASLSGSINETGTISLKRGSIYLGSMDLTLAPTGFIFPYDSKNYIVTDNTGSLIKQGLDTNTFEFPIGTSKAYAKVTLKANANNGDTAGARVIEPLQDSIFNPALPVGTESYVKKQWFIKARALSSKANIGLYWNTSDEVKSPFSDVGYYTGSGWIKTNGVVNNQSASIGNYPLISRTFAVYSPAKITSIDGNLQSSNEIKAWIPQDKNMLNLEFTNNIKQRMQIRLLSSSGQMMYSTTLNTSGKMLAIDIPALAEGVYFISLQTDSYSVVKKVYKF